MLHLKTIVLCLSLSIFQSGVAQNLNFSNSFELAISIDGSVLPLLEYPGWGSEIGLANIGVVSSSQTLSNFYQNPSNLAAGIAGVELFGSHHPIFTDLDNAKVGVQSYGVAYNLNGKHGFGFFYKNLSVEQRKLGSTSAALPDLSAQQENLFSLNYARQFWDFLSVGIGWKYMRSGLKRIEFNEPTGNINVHLIDVGVHVSKLWSANDSLEIGGKFGASLNNLGSKITHFNEMPEQSPHTAAHIGGMFILQTKRATRKDIAFHFYYQLDRLFAPKNQYNFGDFDRNGLPDYLELGFGHALEYRGGSFFGEENEQSWVHHLGLEYWIKGKNGWSVGLRSGYQKGKPIRTVAAGGTVQFKNVFLHLSQSAEKRLESGRKDNYLTISAGIQKLFGAP